MDEELSRLERLRALAREARWTVKNKSRVSHPKYGSVIVPHASRLTAIENAAEYWGCGIMEIINSAKVEWVPKNAGPVRRPKEFIKRNETEQ